MPTGARKITGYSDISEQVLYETSIIRSISNMDVMGSPGTTAVSVYVNALATVATYTPGTGIDKSNDGSAYVALTNLVEIAVNELLDGYTIETAPADLVASRFEGAVGALGESIDTTTIAAVVTGGTTLVSADTVAIGSLVVGTRYIVKTANSGGDASVLAGTAASTAVVNEIFTAIANGTGATALVCQAAVPDAASIYTDVLALKKALDKAKAPRINRSMVITPDMEALLLDTDSKLVLNTDRGDKILADGWIGRVSGFDVYSTTLLTTSNIVCMQKRGFAYKDNWKIEPRLQSLDGSGQFIGDSAIQGRMAYNYGAVRATLIQLNKGVADTTA